MSTVDGWYGPICPNCGHRGGTSEKNVTKCDKCDWTGKFDELLNSDDEYKNNKRTKLIDKILYAEKEN